MNEPCGFRTMADLRAWVQVAPPHTQVEVATFATLITSLAEAGEVQQPAPGAALEPVLTWRERLWLVPAQTRLGVAELTEALGKPKSWVYRHTSPKSGYELLPHRKLDGELVFTAGEVRAWVLDHEEVVKGGRMESTPAERGGLHALQGRAA
jgi:predicted DNA-binding transcriptional regulator AlpA